MILRPALTKEMHEIYFMGFDVWSNGLDDIKYLELCDSLDKYKKGKWWVLEKDKMLLCSLITYQLTEKSIGIGSLATVLPERKKGFASHALTLLLKEFDREFKNLSIYLFADIGPEFYLKFGFQPLPEKFQKVPNTVCMVRTPDISKLISGVKFSPPQYF